MAEYGRLPPILLLLLSFIFFFAPSFSLARKISPQNAGSSTTTTLDIASSLEGAIGVLAFGDKKTLEFPELGAVDRNTAASSSSLSLKLHSRDFLPASTSHKDYKSLTAARLRRDSARVRAISARLDLAVQGISRSDLQPLTTDQDGNMEELEATAGNFEGPIVSGTSQGSGEYFSRVGIGHPAKPLYMVVDTGSDVTWVQCQPCADCYQQSDPIYDPSASSTYAPLPCDSQPCRSLDVSACRNSSSSCLYQVSYGDGSYTVGDFATETLTFGSAPVSGVAFGCGHDNEGLFVGSAGLLGLGGGALSFPSQVSARSFSYCLVDRDSSIASTIDFGAPPADEGASAVTAPLLRNGKVDTFYYVGMVGMSVGGEPLSIPPNSFSTDESGAGGVIVDSGTAITRLQQDAYTALRDAFVKGTTHLPSTSGVALFDTCYDLSSRTSVEVPTVSFRFSEGRELKLPAKNYLIPVDSSGTFCLAFAPTSSPLSIIGNVQQQGTRVSFDLDKSMVGFTPNKC